MGIIVLLTLIAMLTYGARYLVRSIEEEWESVNRSYVGLVVMVIILAIVTLADLQYVVALFDIVKSAL